jgi:seryl-tRNA synthetase
MKNPLSEARAIKAALVKKLERAIERLDSHRAEIVSEIKRLKADQSEKPVGAATAVRELRVLSRKTKRAPVAARTAKKQPCKVCHKTGHDARRHNKPPKRD